MTDLIIAALPAPILLWGLWTILRSKGGSLFPSGKAAGERNTPNKADNNSSQNTARRLMDLVSEMPSAPVISAVKSRRLPNFPNEVFGRDEDIIELINGIKESRPVIGLFGNSGMGKTTLALHLIEKYRFRFEDSQLYLDLRGRGDQPVAVAEAMARVIHTLRPHARIPKDKAKLKTLYQSVLKGQNGIMFLDNVEQSNHIKCLQPPNPWMLIFTSSKPMALSGVVSRKLEPLDVYPAQDLIVRLSPKTRSKSREIAKLCRGIPLALTMCGRFLGGNDQIAPADFASRFRECRDDSIYEEKDEFEESIRAAFNVIYNSLNETEQKTLRSLVVFPDTFESLAEAFVCEDKHGSILQKLVRYGLVQFDSELDRYFLHDKIRKYLKPCLDVAERAAARLQHANFYLTKLISANETYMKGGDQKLAGLQMFDRDWENIHAGLKWARENSWKGKDATHLCSAYMQAGADLLSVRLFYADYMEGLKSALKASKRLEERDAEKNHLYRIGKQYNLRFQYEIAFDHLEQAKDLVRQLKDRETESKVLEEMAASLLGMERFKEAIQPLLKSLDLRRETGNWSGEETALMQLGLAYEKTDEISKAIRYYKNGLTAAHEAGNVSCLGTILQHLGSLHGAKKDSENASRYFEAALELFQKSQDHNAQMKIIDQFSKILIELEETQQARSLIHRGLEMAKLMRNARFAGVFLKRLGDAYFFLRDKPRAIQFYQEAIGVLKKAGESHMEEETNRSLTRALEMGMYEQPVTEANGEEVQEQKVAVRPVQVRKPVMPRNWSTAMTEIEDRTREFIQRGDNTMINYFVGTVEKAINKHEINLNDSNIREKLNTLVGTLREKKHHACATVLKNKFGL